MEIWGWWTTSVFKMLSKRVPLRQIVSTPDGGGEFRFLLKLLNKQGKKSLRQACDVSEHDGGRLPTESYASGRRVYQHQ